MKKVVIGVVTSMLAGALATASLAEGAVPAKLMAPNKGVSFDIGAKRVVGYYLQRAGACDLTMMVADRLGEGAELPPPGSRVNVSVAPGSAARIDTPDGRSLAFVCSLGATAMTVKPLERVAYAPM